jgi:cytochrome P450
MSTVERGAPPLESYSLLDPVVHACPYEFFRRLRSECPVYRMPETGTWLITRYDDIRAIKRNPQDFTSDITLQERGRREVHKEHDRILQTYGWDNVQTLQRTDPPAHARWRNLIDRTFTASRVREMTPYIDSMVHELIDAWIDDGECEFVSQYAIPLPCKVIADQLGVDRDNFWKLKAWSDAMLEPGSPTCSDERVIECAHLVVESQHYFYRVFEDRRKRPRNDIMSALIHTDMGDEPPLTMHELQNLMNQLLTGGNETTTSAISHALWNLLKFPEQMARLRADRSLLKNFVEETLRFETPVLGLARKTTRDVEVSGTAIPKDSLVVLTYAAANRDEDKFDDGETFDVTRKNAGAQIAFGMGAHFCPGAMLARREIQSAFEIMLDRMDDIQLARPLAEQTHEPSIFLHQLRELPITFRKR